MIRRMSWSTISMPRPLSAGIVASRVKQLLALVLVEAGGRLVEEQKARPHRQRAGDLDHALVAVGQRGRGRARPALDAHARERRLRPHGRLGAARADAHGGDHHVLEHAQAAEQAHPLEGPGEPGAGDLIGRPAGQVAAERQDPAAGRRQHAGDHVDQRRLARAVGADQPQDLAALEPQADAVDRAQLVEVLADLLDHQRVGVGSVGGAHAPTVAHPGRTRAPGTRWRPRPATTDASSCAPRCTSRGRAASARWTAGASR